MSSYEKDIEQLRVHATAQGWRYDRASNNHHRFYSPDKHTIVVMPSTPGDRRGWLNGMADMRRGGYVEPNNGAHTATLGDLLPTVPPEISYKAPIPTVPQLIIEYLGRNNRPVPVDEIRMFVKSKRPGTADSTVSQEAARIATDGRIARVSYGMYAALPKEAPSVQAPTPPPHSPVVVLPVVQAEDALADDIEALSKALSALADIEGVVRRTTEKINQLIALRKALGG